MHSSRKTLEAFFDIGYICEIKLLKHCDYEGHTVRKRAFIIAVEFMSSKLSAAVAKTIVGQMFDLVTPPS